MEKDYRNHTQEELLIKIRELEKEVKKLNNQIIKDDRYGLNWIDCPEAFEEESENKIPILEEVKGKAISNDDGKPTHILIEGDNFHALTCLNYTHKGKIDVIYIDPPYNTGSDGFTYKDKRFLKEYPNGQPVPKEHPLRHSYWLSFMSKRLKLAKELLSDNGVIFISIDDNEVAQLKLLCDNVFGEDNSICQFIWEKKRVVQNDAKFVSTNHEYILAYRKSNALQSFNLLPRTDEANARYNNPDNDIRGKWTSVALTAKSGSVNNIYDYIFPNGVYWKPNEGAFPRLSKDSLEKAYFENRLWFGKTGKNVPRLKKYLSEVKNGIVSNSLLFNNIVGSTQLAKEQLKRILSQNIFDTPKPLELIQTLMRLNVTNTSIILDFFAGSGSTMHATMKLNEQDGGRRQSILVQQNENNICEEVCYERNKRVIQGYTNPKGEDIDGLGNSLKYYKTSFVGKHSPNKVTDDDRVELSYKAGYLLALSENTLEEIKKTDYYQIFENKDNATAIYFKEDLRGFDDFVKEVESLEKPTSVYIFSWDNAQGFEYNFEHIERVQIKSIPQAILEIYKSINQ